MTMLTQFQQNVLLATGVPLDGSRVWFGYALSLKRLRAAQAAGLTVQMRDRYGNWLDRRADGRAWDFDAPVRCYRLHPKYFAPAPVAADDSPSADDSLADGIFDAIVGKNAQIQALTLKLEDAQRQLETERATYIEQANRIKALQASNTRLGDKLNLVRQLLDI